VKTPHDVSSERLIRHLVKHWNYRIVRQSGSHVLIESEMPSKHSIPIPNRSAIGLGLFRTILNQVSAAKGVTVEDILRGL
jgi:predicted RNA binding protein YcfA (HicA-like mRNA interferase family)